MHRSPDPVHWPSQKRVLELPIRRRPEMAHLPMELRGGGGGGGDLVVVLQSSDGDERQEVVGIGAGRVEKMRRNRGAGEQMVGGGIWISSRGGGGGGCSAGNPLHPLQIEAVFLQMAGDVLPG